MANAPVYLGVKKVARELDLSENSVRRLADAGKLTCTRDSEGRRQFNRAEILAKKKTRSLSVRSRQALVEA
jgi:hypothetical protein